MTFFDEQLQRHKSQIYQIADTYGVFNIRLFGSVARQDSHAPNDIDFLIELKPGRSLYDLCGFINEVEALLDSPVDAFTEASLKSRVREQALRDARPL